MKKGFTIVELMMVIGIIAVLMGIITTAASSSVKASRTRKADALCKLVQTGLATYYEQKGEWPWGNGLPPGNQDDGAGNSKDPDNIVLSAAQVRQCVKAMVDEAKRGNPVMDISGLFVSRDPGELSGGSGAKGQSAQPMKRSYGLDFIQAIRGTKQSPEKMKSGQMYFGYPDPETGYFLRFKMVYSIPSDSVIVSKQR